MSGLMDFFTQEAGQRRRSALDELGREIGTYVPPELRGILGLIAESTPTASIDRASQSAVRMVEPGRTVEQRIGDLGGLLSETAGVVAPALVGPRAGMTATQALEEMFMVPTAMAGDAARRFVMDESGSIGASSPFANMTRETFLGNPRITGPSNAASLKPKALRGLEDAEKIDFPVGKLTARYDDSGAAVYDGDKVIASYNFGDTLVVDPKYRKQGIGEELVYQWRTRFPAPAATKTRTKVSQRIQENVWDRIQRELSQSTPTTRPATPLEEAHLGGLLASALPAPRNEAEAAAREILEMRAAGRAGDVTDELMAQADPQYMFANTPLPMDEASRMARAREMGRVDDQYHATLADFQAFMPSETGLVGRGVYSGDFPTDIEDYARKQGTSGGLNIIPLLAPSEQTYARRIDWQNLVDADEAFPWNASVGETIQGFRRAADTMSSQGYSGVNSQPGERVTFDPANIRSRFARFDPEFRHLRNLSAGVGGLGLLATQSPEQQREEELRQYLGGLL